MAKYLERDVKLPPGVRISKMSADGNGIFTMTVTCDAGDGTLTWNSSATDEMVAEDIAKTVAILRQACIMGTEKYVGQYRTFFGRLRLAYLKDVGPPVWNRPRAITKLTFEPFHFMLGVGWRYTCHSLHVIWRKEDDQHG